MAEQTQIVYQIRIEGAGEQLAELDKLEQQFKDLNEERQKLLKTQKDNKKLTNEEAKQLEENRIAIRKNSQERRAQNKAIEDTIKYNRSASQSYDKLVADNVRLSAAMRKMEDPMGKNKKAIAAISKEIDKNTNELKKMDAAMGRHQRNVGNYAGAIKGAFMQIGLAIGSAVMIWNTLKGTLEAFDTQAKSTAKLLTALKGNVDALGNLQTLAQQLQATTLFDDDATASAMGMLAAMGLNEGAIKRMIPLVQDFATMMHLDLDSAAKLIGKSIASNTNALMRYGLSMEGAAGSSERLESAITELNKKVGGQAVAAAQAGTGAITQFKNSWDDLMETIGGTIAPTANKIAKFFTDIIKGQRRVREEAILGKATESAKGIISDIASSSDVVAAASIKLSENIAATEKLKADLKMRYGALARMNKVYENDPLVKEMQDDLKIIEEINKQIVLYLQQRTEIITSIDEEVTDTTTTTSGKKGKTKTTEELIDERNFGYLTDAENYLKSLELKKRGLHEMQRTEYNVADGVVMKHRETERVKTAITEAEQEQRMAIVAQTLGMAAATFKQNTAAYKIAASAEALMSTWAAVNKTYKEPLLPFPSNVVMAGIIGALGLANVAKINNVKFAGGGVVPSGHELPGSHRNEDNTLALVKPGEVVLNQQQQSALGGPSTFSSIGVPGFANGGIVPSIKAPTPSPSGMDMSRLAAAMRDQRVFVLESDITKTQKNVRVIESLSSF